MKDPGQLGRRDPGDAPVASLSPSAVHLEGLPVLSPTPRPPRPVSVSTFELRRNPDDPQSLNFRVVCSKGTYIRSLAHDLVRPPPPLALSAPQAVPIPVYPWAAKGWATVTVPAVLLPPAPAAFSRSL